jgi:N-acetylglucosamine-6-phosphate deacetylase
MQNKLCIKNGKLISPNKIEEGRSLFIEDGRIVDIAKDSKGASKGFNVVDAKGLYVSPGFIDVHVHGLFANRIDHITENELRQMCVRMARAGVTAFLATTVTLPDKTLLNTASAIKYFIADNPATNLLGLHLEGPYLNPLSCGAQNRKYIRAFKPNELKKIISNANGLIRMMTFAPERERGMALLSFLIKHRVVPSIGHSQASYEEVEAAVKKGLKHVTHLFNTMPAFSHREPGLIGAALMLDKLSVDIIADGIHLHPATVKLVVKAKGIDKVILISDSIYTGRNSILGGLKVYINKGEARLRDGRLAGSTLSLNQAVRNAMEFAGINLQEAVRMVTINPARLLGIQAKKGSLAAGKDADVVIFDKRLKIKSTIIKGKIWN